MTRTLEQIEADLVTARQAHQGVVVAHQQAVRGAAELRAKATAGDGSVTAKALGDAMHAAEFAELPIPAKLRAITALEAEALVARTEAWADEVTATEPGLRADVLAAFADIEAAHDRLVAASRLHTNYVQQTTVAVGSAVGGDVTPRVVRRPWPNNMVVVDKAEMRIIPVHDRLARIVEKTHSRLFSGHPKVQK